MPLAEGARQFSLRGRGRNLSPFLRRRRRRRDRPFTQRGREFRPRRARALQKGVQDTLGGFLIPPLATPPDLPPAATPCGRASKSEGEHGFYLCALLFLCAVALRLRGLPRMTVRGRMVQGGKSAAGNVFCVKSLLSGFPGVSVGRGAARIDCGCCLTPD